MKTHTPFLTALVAWAFLSFTATPSSAQTDDPRLIKLEEELKSLREQLVEVQIGRAHV